MSKYLFLLVGLAVLLAYSCDESSFSQVVTIDLPEHEPKPVIQFNFNTEDTTLIALLSNSKGILDPESIYEFPEDAEVQLYKNNSLVTDLSFSDQTSKYMANIPGGIVAVAGDVFTVEAQWGDFDQVSVSQTMPQKPSIIEADYYPDSTIDSEGYPVSELVVNIEDPNPQSDNYFGVNLWEKNYIIDYENNDTLGHHLQRIYLYSGDLLSNEGEHYSIILKDEGFTNNRYELRAQSYLSNRVNPELIVEVFGLTKEAFLFERSYLQYYNAIDNPFAEPATVYSNIPDGYGIFMIGNKATYHIN